MRIVLTFIGLLFILGCSSDNNSNVTTQQLPTKFVPNDGRLLSATNCFQCHGTNGYSTTSFDSIAGEDKDEFYESDSPIMKAQVSGFTDSEVDLMFLYLKSLKEKEDYED